MLRPGSRIARPAWTTHPACTKIRQQGSQGAVEAGARQGHLTVAGDPPALLRARYRPGPLGRTVTVLVGRRQGVGDVLEHLDRRLDGEPVPVR
jgi:hypothetical protein